MNVFCNWCFIGGILFIHRLCCIALIMVTVVLWMIHRLHFLKRVQMQFTALSPCPPNTGRSISMLQGTKTHVAHGYEKPLSPPLLILSFSLFMLSLLTTVSIGNLFGIS
jgi:hypothetical protein